MKKKVILIVSIILIFLIVMGGVIHFNDSIRFKLSYEYINFMEYDNGKKITVSIPLNNNVKYLDEKELLTLLNEGTGILYFGYNTCPWCRNAVPVLIDVARKNDMTIYYANNSNLDIKSIKDELFELLNNYLREDEEGHKGLAVPDVYFIKNGKIIGHHAGTIEGYHSPYTKMTSKQSKELAAIYQNLIEEMK